MALPKVELYDCSYGEFYCGEPITEVATIICCTDIREPPSIGKMGIAWWYLLRSSSRSHTFAIS